MEGMIRLALFFLVLFLAAVFDIRKRIIPDWMPFLIAGVSLIPSEPVYLTGLFVALPLLIPTKCWATAEKAVFFKITENGRKVPLAAGQSCFGWYRVLNIMVL
ncbi:MAG: hypothetical protein ACLRZD_04730 [Lachnospira sp.]